jgi:hypothetical protein
MGANASQSIQAAPTRPGCLLIGLGALLSSNAFEVLQAAIGGLDSPHRDYDDVDDDEQPNHQRQHAREPRNFRNNASTINGDTIVAARPMVLQMPLARSRTSVGNSSGV